MRLLYHIVPRAEWEQTSGPYRAASLNSEGFIHCSNRDQVARVANLYYADHADLFVLCIHAERLTSTVRDEDVGSGEPFPHVYGPIDRAAIVEVKELKRGPDGLWQFS
jgi:uncharacterized protein (DUF952 family)